MTNNNNNNDKSNINNQVQMVSIAAMNNKAVGLIVGNRHNEALNIFKRAIQSLKHIMAKKNKNNKVVVNKKLQQQDQQQYDEDYSSFHQQIPLTAIPLSTKRPIAKNASYTYNHALMFENNDNNDDSSLSSISPEIMSAILLYNMAVIHHVSSLVKNNSLNLRKALQIYKLALHFCQAPTARHNKNGSTLFFLSAVQCFLQTICENNMAQIYYETAEYTLLRRTILRLSGHVMYCTRLATLRPIISQDTLRAITLNLVFLTSPTAASAA